MTHDEVVLFLIDVVDCSSSTEQHAGKARLWDVMEGESESNELALGHDGTRKHQGMHVG